MIAITLTRDYLDSRLNALDARFETRIAELKSDLVKWIAGIALAQIGLLVGILLKLM